MSSMEEKSGLIPSSHRSNHRQEKPNVPTSPNYVRQVKPVFQMSVMVLFCLTLASVRSKTWMERGVTVTLISDLFVGMIGMEESISMEMEGAVRQMTSWRNIYVS